jgi:hypothetical protein
MTARDAARGSRLDRPGGVQQRPGEQLRRVDAHPMIGLELIDDGAGDRRGPNHPNQKRPQPNPHKAAPSYQPQPPAPPTKMP